MTISMDKKYRTRDGHEVRIYAVDGVGCCAVHGAILQEEITGVRSGQPGKEWCVTVWGPDGLHIDSKFDLIEVKPRIQRTIWMNVYEDAFFSYFDKESADSTLRPNRLACIKIEIDCEEGEGL